jgi:hypothetical protein
MLPYAKACHAYANAEHDSLKAGHAGSGTAG